MDTNNEYWFSKMLFHLTEEKKVILYNNLLSIGQEDEIEALKLLKERFQKESLDSPFETLEFDPSAALWAAKITYFTAQLILFRNHDRELIDTKLEAFPIPPTPASILSADISLRFLPQMLHELKFIDPEDPLIPMIQEILTTWHYSAIGSKLAIENPDMNPILSSSRLTQLYVNRIIECKDSRLANHEQIQPFIKASLGGYKTTFWNELILDQP